MVSKWHKQAPLLNSKRNLNDWLVNMIDWLLTDWFQLIRHSVYSSKEEWLSSRVIQSRPTTL